MVATLNPYLIWHDVHVNREIVDQLARRAVVRGPLLPVEAAVAAARGSARALTGARDLGNSRLIGLPLVARRPSPVESRGCSAARRALASDTQIMPWLVRNRSRSAASRSRRTGGRSGRRTTSTRRDTCRGKWIDDVPAPRRQPSPRICTEHFRKTGRLVPVDECAQMRPTSTRRSSSGGTTRARKRSSMRRRHGCCGSRGRPARKAAREGGHSGANVVGGALDAIPMFALAPSVSGRRPDRFLASRCSSSPTTRSRPRCSRSDALPGAVRLRTRAAGRRCDRPYVASRATRTVDRLDAVGAAVVGEN